MIFDLQMIWEIRKLGMHEGKDSISDVKIWPIYLKYQLPYMQGLEYCNIYKKKWKEIHQVFIHKK